jgi:tetratricopeptide (TPR) repeat protein
MKQKSKGSVGYLRLIIATCEARLRSLGNRAATWFGRNLALIGILGILAFSGVASVASSQSSEDVTIHGRVLDSRGSPVPGASVRLEDTGRLKTLELDSDLKGGFAFSGLGAGTFSLAAEKGNLHSDSSVVLVRESGEQLRIDLVLANPGALAIRADSSSNAVIPPMEFADSPNFTVAGVTDWTAAGGHGSDASLRTSEALNREALTLKESDGAPSGMNATKDVNKVQEAALRAALAGAPASFDANHHLGEFYLHHGKYDESAVFLRKAFQIDPRNAENEVDLAQACKELGDLSQAREHVRRLLESGGSAAVHRLAGEIDEKSGDSLAAVHEFERAVTMDPSEQSYFEWGSELLIHRAVWQAKEVFERGVKVYPRSARLLTVLGAALFAGALYDQAALRLCEASDLIPDDPGPYLFMGKVEIATPNPLPCVEEKLTRFAQRQPDNSRANYYLAMTVWKQSGQKVDENTTRKIESLLTKAVMIDPKFSDAYVQLGNLKSQRMAFAEAAELYAKAIEADPQSSEAHYRLGVAYDRLGERDKAKQEFQLHEDIERQHAAAIDRERREVKQFVVEVPDKPVRMDHQ